MSPVIGPFLVDSEIAVAVAVVASLSLRLVPSTATPLHLVSEHSEPLHAERCSWAPEGAGRGGIGFRLRHHVGAAAVAFEAGEMDGEEPVGDGVQASAEQPE